MLWRPLRLPRSRRTGFGIARLDQAFPRRRLSSIGAANPSIAAILATPPTGDSQTITAVGSIRTVRNQKQRSFVELGDGSTVQSLQALLEPSQAEGLGTGTSVAITGHWRPAPRGKEQPYELQAEEVRIVGRADPEKYPLQKKYQSAEYLRSIPHLRLRIPLHALLARLKSECDFHLAQYFRDQGFVRVQPPIITSSDCEGAGEVFTVSSQPPPYPDQTGRVRHERELFFRDHKFLTVSSQLHLEAFVHEHQKVWTLSPTFRAEKSDTPRHVSEFWMLEAEMRTEAVEEVMDVVEEMIQRLVLGLQESNFMQELIAAIPKGDVRDIDDRQRADQLRERWDGLVRAPWPRITYTDAIGRLQKAARSNEAEFQFEPRWEKGLHLEHERYLAGYIGQGCPVFVTDYPAAVKPFYMLPSKTDAKSNEARPTAACFDLLLPDGCEVAGGSMREHRFEHLLGVMRSQGMTGTSANLDIPTESANGTPPSAEGEGGDLDWYLDLRRYGSVPHGGFGLGFDRLLGYLAGISSIRDVVSWPRYYGRCDG